MQVVPISGLSPARPTLTTASTALPCSGRNATRLASTDLVPADASACSVRHERVSAGGRQHPAYSTNTETPGSASASTFTETFGAFLSFFEILTSSPDCFTL